MHTGLTPTTMFKTDGTTKALEVNSDGNMVATVPFILPSYTATEIAALTGVDGMMVFDSTNNVVRAYYSSGWHTISVTA
jgi:hypothetical protein